MLQLSFQVYHSARLRRRTARSSANQDRPRAPKRLLSLGGKWSFRRHLHESGSRWNQMCNIWWKRVLMLKRRPAVTSAISHFWDLIIELIQAAQSLHFQIRLLDWLDTWTHTARKCSLICCLNRRNLNIVINQTVIEEAFSLRLLKADYISHLFLRCLYKVKHISVLGLHFLDLILRISPIFWHA